MSDEGPIDPPAVGGTLDAVGVCLLSREGTVLFRDEAFERALGFSVPVGSVLADLSPCLTTISPERAAKLEDVAGVSLTVTPTGLDEAAAVVRAERAMPGDGLERDLQIARGTLASLLDAAPVTILVLDLDQRVTMWNATAQRMFGWDASEVYGRPYPLVPEGERGRFTELFDRVVGGEGFTGVEAIRQRKDGTNIDLRIHTAPMRDVDGRVTGAMAILEDLSEQRRLEAQIRHSQKMEAVGRLAGGVAHDFNNLLTVILGTCEVLERDKTLGGRVTEGLEHIRECGEHARSLTAQLLAFSRRQVLSPEITDISERVQATAGMLSRLIGESIEMKLELTDGPLAVLVDTTQFDQLVVNLVVNARDAMAEGGSLTLRTELDEVAAGHAHVPSGRYARLDVIDDGPGIPKDVLPHIFDPFFTTKRLGHGTGLGLAMVHGVVQQSGGHVGVRSREREGTTFSVWLPLSEATHEATPAPRGVGDAPRGTETVLLVEDDAQVQLVASKMLASLGYTVWTASDGQDALAQLRAGLVVNVILSDLAMPRMGGRALGQALAEGGFDTPLIYISANLDDPEIHAAIDGGDAHFLQKPFTIAALGRAVRTCLDA